MAASKCLRARGGCHDVQPERPRAAPVHERHQSGHPLPLMGGVGGSPAALWLARRTPPSPETRKLYDRLCPVSVCRLRLAASPRWRAVSLARSSKVPLYDPREHAQPWPQASPGLALVSLPRSLQSGLVSSTVRHSVAPAHAHVRACARGGQPRRDCGKLRCPRARARGRPNALLTVCIVRLRT